MSIEENNKLDHEVIDLTKNTSNKESNFHVPINVPIDIPIYLGSNSRGPTELQTSQTKYVGLESPFNKPRIVSTSFIKPMNDANYSFSNNSGTSSTSKNSAFYSEQNNNKTAISSNISEQAQKPRFIYYYDDESFGGY